MSVPASRALAGDLGQLGLGGDVLAGPNQKPFQGKVDYDVIVWIDSDIIFTPEDVFKLLDSPHDVTAGVYMM